MSIVPEVNKTVATKLKNVVNLNDASIFGQVVPSLHETVNCDDANCEDPECLRPSETVLEEPNKYINGKHYGDKQDSANAKLNPAWVQYKVEEAGYKLLTPYTNIRCKLQLLCPNGHIYLFRAASLKTGIRCTECSGHYVNPNKVKKAFEKEGYKLLSEYITATDPMNFICVNNHVHKLSWDNFKQGSRCAFCVGVKIHPEMVEKAFSRVGYTLLSPYVSALQRLVFRCDKGHLHKMSWASFKAGHRCGKCFISRHQNRDMQYVTDIAYATYQREQKYSDIASHKLLEICNSLFTAEIRAFYNKKPLEYHVDHIIPFTWFNHSDEDEIRACWNINNLRYLPALKNISRGNRMTQEEFHSLTNEQLDIFLFASRIPPKIFKSFFSC